MKKIVLLFFVSLFLSACAKDTLKADNTHKGIIGKYDFDDRCTYIQINNKKYTLVRDGEFVVDEFNIGDEVELAGKIEANEMICMALMCKCTQKFYLSE